ncbi:MAG TPA: hypothetical protein ENI80_07315 [Acidiferrobacteraceae bacterium]|nr:hypothetical protein [Acidiferrobacteraceae bacterium]
MNFNNACHLKASLIAEGLNKLLPTIAKLPQAAAVVARTQASARAIKRPRLPLAMGIQGRRGKYKLALRIQEVHPGLNGIVDHIRKAARGECEVRMVGNVVKQAPWYQNRNRPLRIGGSISHYGVEMAGTLGCFVRKLGKPDDDFILSNNHVLANENQANAGDRIIQPGMLDAGLSPADDIGRLDKVIPLKSKKNVVDVALASLDEGTDYYVNWLETLGDITGVRTGMLDEGETVFKVGRTTGVTKGRVGAIELDGLRVGYDTGTKEFNGQIEIEPDGDQPFSLGGDSGSLIMDSQRRVVGLLFAGNDVDATYVNPIGEVLDALKIELAL